MPKNYIIGLDIGSYFTKGILFEEEFDKYTPLAYEKIKTD
jgi:cell division protein FtsA